LPISSFPLNYEELLYFLNKNQKIKSNVGNDVPILSLTVKSFLINKISLTVQKLLNLIDIKGEVFDKSDGCEIFILLTIAILIEYLYLLLRDSFNLKNLFRF